MHNYLFIKNIIIYKGTSLARELLRPRFRLKACRFHHAQKGSAMHKLLVAAVAVAAMLSLSSLNGSANAMTGPGPSKDSSLPNYSLKQDAACQGWGRYCGPGFVRTCGPYRCWCRPCR
jgi:hypothetical protein